VLLRRVERPEGEAVVLVATSTDDVREVLGDLRRALLVVVPLATLALVAVVWWLVGRTLRPVEGIRREVAELELDDLDHRVPVRGTGDEIDRLATTMNDMLTRLDDASQRQRRFVADASHELRTPLARMRTDLDVGAGPEPHGPVDPATRRSLVAEVDSMSALVDDLLQLARSDATGSAPAQRPVDLDDIVLQEVAALRARTTVAIDASGVSAAGVVGDPGELRRVVRNLGDNAARHARRRVEVTLGEEVRDGMPEAVLTVTDDGEGIPPERAESVFDRFARLDAARTRDTGGTGLGLAIARDIVERHGGSITVETSHRPGARFVVVLPARAG
jgi:signal transduction histidine kinase